MGKITFKSLLIAAALCLSTSAWAEDAYTEIYSRVTTFGAENIWAAADAEEWGKSDMEISVPDAADAEGDFYGLGVNGNQTFTAKKSFTVEENSKIKIELTWINGGAPGVNSAWTSFNYQWLQLGDKIRISWTNDYKFFLNTDATSSRDNEIEKLSKDTQTSSISVIYNTATQSIESFILRGIDLTSSVSDVQDANITSVSFGFIRNTKVTWSSPLYIKDITVSECKQTVSLADYTINYNLGETLVCSTTGKEVVGNTVTAERCVYDDEGNRYFVSANELPTKTIAAGENELNVPVRKAYSATLSLTTTIGETSTTKETTFIEAEDNTCTWTYAYPLYVKSGDAYYKADKTETFGESGTFTDGQTITRTVAYTKDENVVLFYESGANAGTNYSYSNGETGWTPADNYTSRGNTIGTLPAGIYEFVVSIVANETREIDLRRVTSGNVSDDSNLICEVMSKGLNTAEFVLTDETNLLINGKTTTAGKTNQSADFDYVLIKKIGDATVSTSISSAGYATFSSAYAVDFSAAEGLTAYTATVSDDKVVLTAIEDGIVPANTGVILKGVAGDYTGAITTTETVIEDNALVAATEEIASLETETTVNEVAYTNYILNNGSEGIGFYKAAGKKVAAGKAYLQVPVEQASAAKALTIVWNDGETTGINSVETVEVENGNVYDLSGRMVANPTKGLYIKNGKKFIVK